jgi:hypothetical protein
MYQIRINEKMPYFAELPYYLWGQVNYDSEGDCKRPTDQSWTWLYLRHRNRSDYIEVACENGLCTVEGSNPDAARTTLFLAKRCGGEFVQGQVNSEIGDWDHEAGMERAAQVEVEFQNSDIEPFDIGHWFWGSWKWIGWFGTKFTWVGRWIIHSVPRRDTRAVNLCIEWLKAGTVGEEQSKALRYALNMLTGKDFQEDREWISWYYENEGFKEYPEPDLDKWYEELKKEYSHLEIEE